jgi:predicted nucleotidyltransferase
MAKSADSVEKKLKDFVALMRARYNIYAVVLYGSYAEGRANDDSDIDVAVQPGSLFQQRHSRICQ